MMVEEPAGIGAGFAAGAGGMQMGNLREALYENRELLGAIADIWDAPIENIHREDRVAFLEQWMLNQEHAERVWAGLDPLACSAIQQLKASKGIERVFMFERLYGAVDQYGERQIERDQPHRNPQSIAEQLILSGLIFRQYADLGSGITPIVVLPDDLADVLPLHQTTYSDLAPEDGDPGIPLEPIEEVENKRTADTSIVDDMVTLLAYLRRVVVPLHAKEPESLHLDAIMPYLLTQDEPRLRMMFRLGQSAGLVAVDEGRAVPDVEGARRWLGLSRSQQLAFLVRAWRASTTLIELELVPGLVAEQIDPYQPAEVRERLLEQIGKCAPPRGWWSIEDFIEAVQREAPDFQRPLGDYDRWYIRSEDGEYLKDFKSSWYAVEGALIEFFIGGPMHWLGLVDMADDAARLTVYGRSIAHEEAWPDPVDEEDPPEMDEDGTIRVPRRASRVARYQIARMTTWKLAGDPYVYLLDAAGLAAAQAQGLDRGQVSAILARYVNREEGAPQPSVAVAMQGPADGAGQQVQLRNAIVLRTVSEAFLDELYAEPDTRRLLGERLGPMACVVLGEVQADGLAAALERKGVQAVWA
jgi:hypothetical protein